MVFTSFSSFVPSSRPAHAGAGKRLKRRVTRFGIPFCPGGVGPVRLPVKHFIAQGLSLVKQFLTKTLNQFSHVCFCLTWTNHKVYIKTMKSKTLRKYIKFRELSISQAAQEIGISRQTLYEALNGRPLGKRAALKIEDWSEGFLLAADLAGLNRDRETVQ
jgi:hypothetical protein